MENKLDDILEEEVYSRNRKKYHIVACAWILLMVLYCTAIIIWLPKQTFLMPLISPLGFVIGPWARKKYPTAPSSTTK